MILFKIAVIEEIVPKKSVEWIGYVKKRKGYLCFNLKNIFIWQRRIFILLPVFLTRVKFTTAPDNWRKYTS